MPVGKEVRLCGGSTVGDVVVRLTEEGPNVTRNVHDRMGLLVNFERPMTACHQG